MSHDRADSSDECSAWLPADTLALLLVSGWNKLHCGFTLCFVGDENRSAAEDLRGRSLVDSAGRSRGQSLLSAVLVTESLPFVCILAPHADVCWGESV